MVARVQDHVMAGQFIIFVLRILPFFLSCVIGDGIELIGGKIARKMALHVDLIVDFNGLTRCIPWRFSSTFSFCLFGRSECVIGLSDDEWNSMVYYFS